MDVSETGLKMTTDWERTGFEEKQKLEGQLIFPEDRGSFSLKSTVIRVVKDSTALLFDTETRIPLPKIMEEQRIHIRKNPHTVVSEKPHGNMNRRRFFRVRFHAPNRPRFACRIGTYDVLDLSEGGLRIAMNADQTNLQEQHLLAGEVLFPARYDAIDIRGFVVRVREKEAALEFHAWKRIPFSRIMEEQRILIRRRLFAVLDEN